MSDTLYILTDMMSALLPYPIFKKKVQGIDDKNLDFMVRYLVLLFSNYANIDAWWLLLNCTYFIIIENPCDENPQIYSSNILDNKKPQFKFIDVTAWEDSEWDLGIYQDNQLIKHYDSIPSSPVEISSGKFIRFYEESITDKRRIVVHAGNLIENYKLYSYKGSCIMNGYLT